MNWGDVPTWLATFGAFIAAGFAWRALGVELGRDERREDDDKRRQASLVTAWMSNALGSTDSRGVYGGLIIRNASEALIYDVQVRFLRDGKTLRGGIFSRALLPPGVNTLPSWQLGDAARGLIERTQTPDTHGNTEVVVGWEDYLVEITFKDSAGRRWRRGVDGDLEMLSEPAQ